MGIEAVLGLERGLDGVVQPLHHAMHDHAEAPAKVSPAITARVVKVTAETKPGERSLPTTGEMDRPRVGAAGRKGMLS